MTITLKATPAPETVKTPGAKGGSWGKPGSKPKAATVEEGVKVNLSNATTGFEIPVKTGMFDSGRI